MLLNSILSGSQKHTTATLILVNIDQFKLIVFKVRYHTMSEHTTK